MHHWNTNALILNIRAHGENGAIIHVLSAEYGQHAGYVYQAHSTKMQALLQPGYLVEADWTAKQPGQLGQFKLGGDTNWPALLMDKRHSLLALKSACLLAHTALGEHEPHPALFYGTLALFEGLNSEAWAESYIMWEMGLLKEMGFALDLEKCVVCQRTDTLTHVSPKSGCAVCAEHAKPYETKLFPLPEFMGGTGTLHDAITMTGHFLEHRLFTHTSMQNLPEPRVALADLME